MLTWRTGLIATAVLLASTATVTAAQRSVSAAPAAPPNSGIAKLHKNVDLPAGVWTDTPLEVTLPRRGTYALNADVRGRLSGATPLNTYITARLWNVTSGAAVSESERLVYQIINLVAGTRAGGNQTAPIAELIRVPGPTTIRLQAEDVNATGTASIAQIYSDGAGFTSLRYVRVNP